VEANAHVEAVEEFYAENSSMRENQGEPRIGRDLHIANEHRFLSRLKSLTSKCVRPIFVKDDFVVIRWNFTFELHDGMFVTMDELTYQRWEGYRGRAPADLVPDIDLDFQRRGVASCCIYKRGMPWHCYPSALEPTMWGRLVPSMTQLLRPSALATHACPWICPSHCTACQADCTSC
jgi:hypothetical protein